MGAPRPENPDVSQAEQAALLRATGNASTEPEEEALLAELYSRKEER